MARNQTDKWQSIRADGGACARPYTVSDKNANGKSANGKETNAGANAERRRDREELRTTDRTTVAAGTECSARRIAGRADSMERVARRRRRTKCSGGDDTRTAREAKSRALPAGCSLLRSQVSRALPRPPRPPENCRRPPTRPPS